MNQLVRFMSNPVPSHVAAARRVLRYLPGIRSLGITYRRSGQDATVTSVGGHVFSNTLTASSDTDVVGTKDRRSVSGCLMFNGSVVTMSSKRHPVTVISSTESEFYSVSQCALDCVYLRLIMEMLGYCIGTIKPIPHLSLRTTMHASF